MHELGGPALNNNRNGEEMHAVEIETKVIFNKAWRIIFNRHQQLKSMKYPMKYNKRFSPINIPCCGNFQLSNLLG